MVTGAAGCLYRLQGGGRQAVPRGGQKIQPIPPHLLGHRLVQVGHGLLVVSKTLLLSQHNTWLLQDRLADCLRWQQILPPSRAELRTN